MSRVHQDECSLRRVTTRRLRAVEITRPVPTAAALTADLGVTADRPTADLGAPADRPTAVRLLEDRLAAAAIQRPRIAQVPSEAIAEVPDRMAVAACRIAVAAARRTEVGDHTAAAARMEAAIAKIHD